MLRGSFNGVSRKIEGYFNGVLSGFQLCLKVAQWIFKGRFKVVKWQMNFKKISHKVSRVFQKSFHEVSFLNFVVAWISSQLPEQKEGLFTII